MAGFSALMPSVMRLIGAAGDAGVHVAAQVTTPLADWGRCFGSEDEVERVLDALEPLLLLLSLARYGVPEVALGAANVAKADVVSVSMPALELRRGTTAAWTAAPTARVGLRVCPTTTSPLDLAPELTAYQPTFSTKACGWLMLPVNETDPVTALDDMVGKTLWTLLAAKVAKGSADVGVKALVDTACAYANPLRPLATLPDLASNALVGLQALGAAKMLEAEFLAESAGRRLSQQMLDFQALAGKAQGWLPSLEWKSKVSVLPETLAGWWPGGDDTAVGEEPADPPANGWFEMLGPIRALLACVGTTSVVDTGAAPPVADAMPPPLARLVAIRAGKPAATSDADWQTYVAADELYRSFVKMTWDATKMVATPPIKQTLVRFTFTRSPDWDGSKFPALATALADRLLTRTLDFARTRFELDGDAEGTTYLNIENAKKVPDKQDMFTGAAGRRTFWCSALSIWTLAAAGYDLDQDVLGLAQADGKREPHGYIDHNGWVAIRPWMLIDGQAEACMAAAIILNHARESDSAVERLQQIPGRTVVFDYSSADPPVFTGQGSIRDLSALAKPINSRPPASGSAPKEPTLAQILEQPALKSGVTVGISSLGLLNPYVIADYYEEDTYTGSTIAGRDYRDNLAVQYGPGTVHLLGLGRKVNGADIRPGDFGQYQERYAAAGPYVGKGHAFQIWSVKLLLADATELVIDVDTAPAGIPADARATAYRCIDANLANVGTHPGSANGNSGVSISNWILVANPTKLNVGRRYYFARLHESPWSEANLKAAAAQAGR